MTGNETAHLVKEKLRPRRKCITTFLLAVIALMLIWQGLTTGHFTLLSLHFESAFWIWSLALFGAGLVTGLVIASGRAHKEGHPRPTATVS